MTRLSDSEHARQHPEDFLPFVTGQEEKRHYWQIKQTGDAHMDHCIGVIYGVYFIQYLHITGLPDIAEEILRDMPSATNNVEQGLFEALANYIATGTVSLSGFDIIIG